MIFTPLEYYEYCDSEDVNVYFLHLALFVLGPWQCLTSENRKIKKWETFLKSANLKFDFSS